MEFRETSIEGAWVVSMQPVTDERGGFARAFAREEFENLALETVVEHVNISWNRHRGTLRGMHYQAAPHEEAKLVRCSRGSVHDVIVDLRRESTTYREWFAVELRADGEDMLYVPPGVAHGFLTLEDDCELTYLMSYPYVPSHSRGVRWNDPAFQIEWPFEPHVISIKDANYSDVTL